MSKENKVKILMVDDDPSNLSALEAILEGLGQNLIKASSGKEALRHVLIGGNPPVQAFAEEVADAEGGEPLPPHQATKIIGQVLAEIDS